MTTITISLPASLETFVESQVAARGYGDIGAYILGLLEEAQAQREDAELEALLLEGIDSGSLSLDEQFPAKLAGNVEELLNRHGDRAGS